LGGVVADGVGVAVGAELGVSGVQLIFYAVLRHHGRAVEQQIDLAIAHVGMLSHGFTGLESDGGQQIGPSAQVRRREDVAEGRTAGAVAHVVLDFRGHVAEMMDHGWLLLFSYLWYLLPAWMASAR